MSDRSQGRRRLAKWLCIASAVAAAAGYTVFVVRNAVDVVWWDQWANVPVLHAYDAGRLTWSKLWTQAANNRVVVPRAIDLAVGKLFRLDLRVELLCAVLFLAIAAVLLMLTQRRNDGGPLWLYAPAAVFLFSIVQWQSALWNIQMPRFLILALFAVALYAVCRSPGWGSLAVAAFAAVVASLSLLDGFLLWPSVALVIWCAGGPQRARRLTAWALVALVTAFLYVVGYHFAGNSGDAGYVIRHPLASARYVLVLLGGFSRAAPADSPLASVCGVLMLALAAWVVARFWRSDRRLAGAVPVALVMFVLLFDVWTLIGRGSAGPAEALGSRYTTYNLLIFVAAYFALVSREPWRVGEARRRPVLAAVAVAAVAGGLVVVLVIASATTARHEGHAFAAYLRSSARVLHNYRTEPPSQLDAYLCPEFCRYLVLREAPFLEAHGYSVFAGRAVTPGSSVATVPATDTPGH
ncbi:MAG: hypothetical protein JO085_12575 [Acidimicrobiia bacterium]|nr:hypothetical protein [Acidimicrobiia bacterium]